MTKATFAAGISLSTKPFPSPNESWNSKSAAVPPSERTERCAFCPPPKAKKKRADSPSSGKPAPPSSLFLLWRRLHVHQLPDVPVEILKAVAVHHTAMILRRLVGAPPSGHGLADEFVDFLPARARKTHQHLRVGLRIGNRIRRERLEERFRQQHHKD